MLPHEADYILTVIGSGVGAINTRTGVTDYSTKSGDHAPVFQSAVTNLLAAGGPTSGIGGLIAFKGQAQFQSQLVIHPNVGLIGQGPLAWSPNAVYGSCIQSTYNGSIILVTGDSRASTFVYLADFTILGSQAQTAQVGIEWNTSGGNVYDTICDRLVLSNMGQYSYLVGGSGTKVWLSRCYAENCVSDAIHQTDGQLRVSDCYITNNRSHAINVMGGVGATIVVNSTFNGNTGGRAIWIEGSAQHVVIEGNVFSDNGGGSNSVIQVNNLSGANQSAVICGNAFRDDRGGSGAPQFIVIANGNTVAGLTVTGNSFTGVSAPIAVTAQSGNKIIVKNNHGFNDVNGNVASPFAATAGRMGIEGSAASPTASTAFTVDCTDLYLVTSGGTGVSITITDPAGNTVQSGLTSFTGILPVGYAINFGAFSVAPTVYAGVV